MGYSAIVVAWMAVSSVGATIPQTEVEQQNAVFHELWNDEFAWKFDRLPTQGGVPKARIPYSGHMYLDKNGGTASSMRKYDHALNPGQGEPAMSWEYGDTSEARRTRVVSSGRGLFRTTRTTSVNHWYGHCNGWSAAAIRHAEPQHSVTLHGVTFSPADIKGMLAEVYMYNQHEILAGYEEPLNAGTLHAILANWIGRGRHPVVMDSDPGEEKWNYPVYAFASSSAQRSPTEVEVRTNIFYAKDTSDREYDQSPRNHKTKSFHYMLQLNPRGEIVGGYYFTDSDRIDFLWVPLSPRQSGEEGNQAGNPHLDVFKVMEIWRQSVSRETRRQWLIVDPAEADRGVEVPDPNKILPRNIRIVPPALPAQAIVRNETSDDPPQAADASESDVPDPLATTTRPDSESTDSDPNAVEPTAAPLRAIPNQAVATSVEPPASESNGSATQPTPAARPATAEPQPAEPTSPPTRIAPVAGLTDDDILSILGGAAN